MKWWQVTGWPSPDEWQALWAFVTVLVAVAAAIVALVQHRASIRSRQEQARPMIVVDYAFDHGFVIVLEVQNTGVTAATDIRFSWSERPLARDDRAQEPIDRTLINQGIPFLAPGRVMRFYFRPFDEDATQKHLEVDATYGGSGDALTWTSRSVLDLNQWAELLVEPDHLETIAEQVKIIATAARRGEDPIRHMGRASSLLKRYLEESPEVVANIEKERRVWDERARLAARDAELSAQEREAEPPPPA